MKGSVVVKKIYLLLVVVFIVGVVSGCDSEIQAPAKAPSDVGQDFYEEALVSLNEAKEERDKKDCGCLYPTEKVSRNNFIYAYTKKFDDMTDNEVRLFGSVMYIHYESLTIKRDVADKIISDKTIKSRKRLKENIQDLNELVKINLKEKDFIKSSSIRKLNKYK